MPDNPDQILRIDAVLEMTGLSRSALYRLQADGRFPRGHHLAGTKAVGFSRSAVAAWIADQLNPDAERA